MKVCTRQVRLPTEGMSHVRRFASPKIAVIYFAVLARVACQASQIHPSITPFK